MRRIAILGTVGAVFAVGSAMLMPGSAVADKLDDLKAQGFARVAIANEPPYTAVAAAGKVSGAAPDVAR